jgi:hypothetical protein
MKVEATGLYKCVSILTPVVSSLQRPLDERSHPRIVLETEAVLALVDRLNPGVFEYWFRASRCTTSERHPLQSATELHR